MTGRSLASGDEAEGGQYTVKDDWGVRVPRRPHPRCCTQGGGGSTTVGASESPFRGHDAHGIPHLGSGLDPGPGACAAAQLPGPKSDRLDEVAYR